VPRDYGWWLCVFLPCLLSATTFTVSALPDTTVKLVLGLLCIATLAVSSRLFCGFPVASTVLWIVALWLLAAALWYFLPLGNRPRPPRTRVVAIDESRGTITCQFDVVDDRDCIVHVASIEGRDQTHEVTRHWFEAKVADLRRVLDEGGDRHAAAVDMAMRFPFVQFGPAEGATEKWVADTLLAFSDPQLGAPSRAQFAACVACRDWAIRIPPETGQTLEVPVEGFMLSRTGRICIRYARLVYRDDRVPLMPRRWAEATPIILAF